jgi:hypothetical protein
MQSIDLFTIRLRENGGTNVLFYKIKNELKRVGINYCIFQTIPEIENIYDAIKQSCSVN